LHAKIYLNENKALITSMNLYDTSQEKNYEIGVLLKNKEIIDEYVKTYIIENIFNNGKIDELTKKSDNNLYKLLEKNLFFEKYISYCVNCGEPRKYKRTHKYCENCFNLTVEEKREFDIWNYCHECGEKYERKNPRKPYDRNEDLSCIKCNTKRKNI
jgi:hypothetical protein